MKLKAAVQNISAEVTTPFTLGQELASRVHSKTSAWYHRDDASGDKKSRAFRFSFEKAPAKAVCLGDWVVIHSASMPDQSCVSIESKSNPTLLVKDYSPHKEKHEDFLFELVPRQKVNVDGLVELVKTSRSGPFDDRFLHSFENLKREQVHYESSWKRTPLTYGQTIQLKHVSTQRFLASKELWSNYTVSLESSNKNCWFSVRPLGQSRMGSVVKEGDMFLLVSLSCGAVLRQTSLHNKASFNLLTLSFVPGRVFDLLHGWTMTVHSGSNSRSMLRNGQQLRLYFNNTNAIGQWYQEGYIMGNLHQPELEPDIVHWCGKRMYTPKSYHSIFEIEVVDKNDDEDDKERDDDYDGDVIQFDKTIFVLRLHTPYMTPLYLSDSSEEQIQQEDGTRTLMIPITPGRAHRSKQQSSEQKQKERCVRLVSFKQDATRFVFVHADGAATQPNVTFGVKLHLKSTQGLWLHCKSFFRETEDTSEELRSYLPYQPISLHPRKGSADALELKAVPEIELRVLSNIRNILSELTAIENQCQGTKKMKKESQDILGKAIAKLLRLCGACASADSSVHSYRKILCDKPILEQFVRLLSIVGASAKKLKKEEVVANSKARIFQDLFRLLDYCSAASNQATRIILVDLGESLRSVIASQVNNMALNGPTMNEPVLRVGVISKTLSTMFVRGPLMRYATFRRSANAYISMLVGALAGADLETKLSFGSAHFEVLSTFLDATPLLPLYQRMIIRQLANAADYILVSVKVKSNHVYVTMPNNGGKKAKAVDISTSWKKMKDQRVYHYFNALSHLLAELYKPAVSLFSAIEREEEKEKQTKDDDEDEPEVEEEAKAKAKEKEEMSKQELGKLIKTCLNPLLEANLVELAHEQPQHMKPIIATLCRSTIFSFLHRFPLPYNQESIFALAPYAEEEAEVKDPTRRVLSELFAMRKDSGEVLEEEFENLQQIYTLIMEELHLMVEANQDGGGGGVGGGGGGAAQKSLQDPYSDKRALRELLSVVHLLLSYQLLTEEDDIYPLPLHLSAEKQAEDPTDEQEDGFAMKEMVSEKDEPFRFKPLHLKDGSKAPSMLFHLLLILQLDRDIAAEEQKEWQGVLSTILKLISDMMDICQRTDLKRMMCQVIRSELYSQDQNKLALFDVNFFQKLPDQVKPEEHENIFFSSFSPSAAGGSSAGAWEGMTQALKHSWRLMLYCKCRQLAIESRDSSGIMGQLRREVLQYQQTQRLKVDLDEAMLRIMKKMVPSLTKQAAGILRSNHRFWAAIQEQVEKITFFFPANDVRRLQKARKDIKRLEYLRDSASLSKILKRLSDVDDDSRRFFVKVYAEMHLEAYLLPLITHPWRQSNELLMLSCSILIRLMANKTVKLSSFTELSKALHLLKKPEVGKKVVLLICHLFKGARYLCMRVRVLMVRKLIELFIHGHSHNEAKHAAKILMTLIRPYKAGPPVVQNQNLIVKLLDMEGLNSIFTNKTLHSNTSGSGSSSSSNNNKHAVSPGQDSRQVLLLKLLGKCADAQNFLAEAMCQRCMSFRSCLERLAAMSKTNYKEKATYVYFLDEVYLNTEEDMVPSLEQPVDEWWPLLFLFLSKAVEELVCFCGSDSADRFEKELAEEEKQFEESMIRRVAKSQSGNEEKRKEKEGDEGEEGEEGEEEKKGSRVEEFGKMDKTSIKYILYLLTSLTHLYSGSFSPLKLTPDFEKQDWKLAMNSCGTTFFTTAFEYEEAAFFMARKFYHQTLLLLHLLNAKINPVNATAPPTIEAINNDTHLSRLYRVFHSALAFLDVLKRENVWNELEAVGIWELMMVDGRNAQTEDQTDESDDEDQKVNEDDGQSLHEPPMSQQQQQQQQQQLAHNVEQLEVANETQAYGFIWQLRALIGADSSYGTLLIREFMEGDLRNILRNPSSKTSLIHISQQMWYDARKELSLDVNPFKEVLAFTSMSPTTIKNLLIYQLCNKPAASSYSFSSNVSNNNNNNNTDLLLKPLIRRNQRDTDEHPHALYLRFLRTYKLNWEDLEDRAIISDAVLVVFPLLGCGDPDIVTQAAKFLRSLITTAESSELANDGDESDDEHEEDDDQQQEKIYLSGAVEKAQQTKQRIEKKMRRQPQEPAQRTAKRRFTIRQYMMSVYMNSNSSFVQDMKALIERGCAELQRMSGVAGSDWVGRYFRSGCLKNVLGLLEELCTRKSSQNDDFNGAYNKNRKTEKMEEMAAQRAVQDYMREQHHRHQEETRGSNNTSVNLVSLTVHLLKKLAPLLSNHNISLVKQVLKTLTAFAEANQVNRNCIVFEQVHTAANLFFQPSFYNQLGYGVDMLKGTDLIEHVLTLLLSLVEGNPNTEAANYLASRLTFKMIEFQDENSMLLDPSWGTVIGGSGEAGENAEGAQSAMQQGFKTGVYHNVLEAQLPEDSETDPETLRYRNTWKVNFVYELFFPDGMVRPTGSTPFLWSLKNLFFRGPRAVDYEVFTKTAYRVKVQFFTLLKIFSSVTSYRQYHVMQSHLEKHDGYIPIGNIEVLKDHADERINKPEIQTIYFPIPRSCWNIETNLNQREHAKEKLQKTFVFENEGDLWKKPTDRAVAFVDWAEHMLIEIEREEKVNQNWRRFVAKKSKFEIPATLLAIVINVILLVTFTGYEDDWRYGWGEGVILALGICHTLLAGLMYASLLLKDFKVIILSKFSKLEELKAGLLATEKERMAKVIQEKSYPGYMLYSLRMLITEPHVLYYTLYLAASILGTVHWPYWFCLNLFSVLVLSAQIRSLLWSFRPSVPKIILLAALLVPCLYAAAVIAFLLLRSLYDDDQGESYCSSVADCLLANLNYGITGGGGLLDSLANYENGDDWSYKIGVVAFFLIFWIVVGLVLLNIILAIIVDTFGEFRDRDGEYSTALENSCMICSLPRERFQKLGGREVYQSHIHSEHNFFYYLYFFAYLKHKQERYNEEKGSAEKKEGINKTKVGAHISTVEKKIKWTHLEWELLKRINNMTEQDLLSIFPLERSQFLEEVDANEADGGNDDGDDDGDEDD